MQQRRIGAAGLRVSRLGLGTMTWGRDTAEDDAAAQLAAFTEAGGTLVETAAGYADGDSELIIGRLLDRVVPRADVVLATGTAGGTGPDGGSADSSRRHLLAALDTSLRRLRTDHVDLWQVSGWDDGAPLEETMSAVDNALTSGRARYAGVANYRGWQLARAATWQQAWPGRARIASVQVEYSLLAREVEQEVLPAAADCGVGVLCWSPLGRGVLTGKYRTGIPADSRAAGPYLASFVRPYLNERSRAIVEAVSTAADGLGVSPIGVALSWVADRPGVTAAIAGARTMGQLDAILTAQDVLLPPEISAALDDVSAVAQARPSR
jgi:aryl-alcohol dehydrogenase-like predicted oxidoreductase